MGVGDYRGSTFLSRLANYHPTRFTKFAWLDVAYKPPTGEPFSAEAVNEATEKALGYPIFGYWLFFRDDDAGRMIDEHVCNAPVLSHFQSSGSFTLAKRPQRESMVSLRFAADDEFAKNTMCPIGACRSYFEKGGTCATADWVQDGEIDTYRRIMDEAGGYAPCLNWYKAQMANINTPDEKEIKEEDKHIRLPALLVCSSYPATTNYTAEEGTDHMRKRPHRSPRHASGANAAILQGSHGQRIGRGTLVPAGEG